MGSLIRAVIPIMKSPPPNTITMGIRFQLMNFEKTQIFSPWHMVTARQAGRVCGGVDAGVWIDGTEGMCGGIDAGVWVDGAGEVCGNCLLSTLIFLVE